MKASFKVKKMEQYGNSVKVTLGGVLDHNPFETVFHMTMEEADKIEDLRVNHSVNLEVL